MARNGTGACDLSTSSNIEWTDATWNPVVGCTRVSSGCDNCYAVAMTHRLESMANTGDLATDRKANYRGLTVLNPRGERHFNGVVRCVDEALTLPFRWRKPRRIFVNSMSDLFHRDVPFEFVAAVFGVAAACRRHTFQILTKRSERAAEFFAWIADKRGRIAASIDAPSAACCDALHHHAGSLYNSDWFPDSDHWPLPNVWLGTSCEDQAAADERIPHLLRCPAAVRFLSCEPLLGEIDLDAAGATPCDDVACPDDVAPLHPSPGVDWVIVGGESGPGARPCSINWINSIETQCFAANVPLFVKQLGSRPIYDCTPSGENELVGLRDKKGGDPDEWPAHLRSRRQFPRTGRDGR